MKTIISLFIVLFVFTANAQDTKPKNQIIDIQTSAVCGECKERLENKLNYTKGVVFAELDLDTKIITVKFKTKTISDYQIHQIISNTGYHAGEMPRNETAFNKLPLCCRDKNATCTKK
jgi:copper chaperone CopZ